MEDLYYLCCENKGAGQLRLDCAADLRLCFCIRKKHVFSLCGSYYINNLFVVLSVILRKSDHPHTKNLRKSDPVSRYQEFRKSWDQQRAPGEKNHKNLRWNVREQMLAQDVVYEKVSNIVR